MAEKTDVATSVNVSVYIIQYLPYVYFQNPLL
jgi:hypothetical protein